MPCTINSSTARPRAGKVGPWVFGRRHVKRSARELMGKRPLTERRYRTAARLRAGSEIMGREEQRV